MRKKFDLIISFQLPELRFVFEQLFLHALKTNVQFNIQMKSIGKEGIGKEFLYSDRWITVSVYSGFIHGNKEQQKAAYTLFVSYFKKLLEIGISTNYLFKMIFNTKDKKRFVFLFEQFDENDVEKKILLASNIVHSYEKSETDIQKAIQNAYRLQSRKFYFKFQKNQWNLLDIVFEAGKMHHDHIPNEINDKRTHKAGVWLHKNDFTKRVYHRNRWTLKVGREKYVRLQPNDIALYSSIVQKNLQAAKEIYENNENGIFNYIPIAGSESELLDYFEHIITAVIFAYTAIEALINICIPFNYTHTKTELNKRTKKKIQVKHDKDYIERWYTLVDKFNEVLPRAINIPKPNREKWWFNFTQLKEIRNKIVHAVEAQSNERYSELLDQKIFVKINSYTQALDFIGKNLTEQKHFLLNEFPYGFGYDDIRPYLIGDDIYYPM